MTYTEPIAIIGVGCRFPGAKNPGAFWKLLREGGDAITEVPADRWNVDAFYDPTPGARGKMNTRWGGFLEQIDLFDLHFFGISPREAVRMDPQQRLLLEVAWEALEDAGQVPERLAGTQTGVFIGISSNDYGRIQMYPSLSDAYMASGNASSIAANRLSYVLNLQGPSMAVDTACSSSLVAVHLACRGLWNRESTLALVGGVNVILSPTISMNFTQAGMLSPDGRCRTFDAGANGYVRGEGAGIVVLKPLSRALADDDPIYAVIRGTAVNQDGHTSGLTVPSQSAQEAVILEACRRAGVSPGQIDYIEAHGTGTPVGDPIEAKALGAVLAMDRLPASHCSVGSVKTNIGHLEAGSGIAGLIKVVLSLKHREIPPNLHFREPNPQIPFHELPLRVQQTLGRWAEKSGPALAGVNSFGFGGTNAHVVLAEAPRKREKKRERKTTSSSLHVPVATSVDPSASPSLTSTTRQAYLLPLSARSQEALGDLARGYQDLLAEDQEGAVPSLQDMCYTASVRRGHHDLRLALVVHSHEELVEQLKAFLQREARPGMSTGCKDPGRRSKLVFVFPGQGSQWWAMGRQLLDQEPVFRQKIEQCDEILQQHAGWSLMAQLTGDEAQSRLNETEIAQPALLALQVALADLWRCWGVVPDAVVGHSMGEVAAAHVAGVLGLQDAVRIIFHRGRLMQQATGHGKMAAVELSWDEARRALTGYEDRLSVAAYNSPISATLSGDPAALEAVLQSLQQKGVFVRMLPVNYAFHSSQMEPFQDEISQSLPGLELRPPTISIFSTVTGQASNDRDFDAAYWARNLREPVLFSRAIQGLIEDGDDFFVELSPHPTLFGPIAQCLRNHGREGAVLPSLRRGEDERAVMLGTLGALYTLGYTVDWDKLYPTGGRCVRLPSYPWQRERCWLDIEEEDLGDGVWRGASGTHRHPLLGRSLKSAHPIWEIELNKQFPPYLDDHRVQGITVLPGTAYVEMALAAAAEAIGAGPRVLADLEFHKALFLPESGSRKAQVVLSPAAGGETAFHIYSRLGSAVQPNEPWTLHATGKILLEQDLNASQVLQPVDLEQIRARCEEEIPRGDFYQRLHERGLEYGPCFQGIERLWRGDGEALGQLRVPQALEKDVEIHQLHPAILDASLQVFAATVLVEARDGSNGGVYLPVRIERVRIYDRPSLCLWSHARLRPYAERSANAYEGDIRLLDEAGRLLVEVSGLRVQQVERPAGEDPRDWLCELVWEPKTRPGQELVHLPADYMPTAHQIAERLQLQVARLNTVLEPSRKLGPQVEIMSTAYVLKALHQLGWEPRLHQRVSAGSLAEQLGVVPQQRRFWGRLLERLEEEGVLRNVGSEWEVCQAPSMEDPEELRKAILVQAPDCVAELTLLGRCGRGLAEVLRGERDPLQLLFPDGSLTTDEQMYQSSPFTRAFNTLVQEAICTALERLPVGRTVRVLEIGAGTGGLTTFVLPKLPANRTEFVFTDVSSLFLLHAKQKFHDYPFVRHQLLDIERDPGEQGFTAHQFDMILASHVLHATSDLRRTLRNVQQLLKSEGLLVLLEGEGLHGMYDLVFAMTEGWWKFADLDLRPSHPLLSQRKWREVLQEVGFTEAVAMPQREDSRKGDLSRQVVILARGPRVELEARSPEAISTLPESRGSWLIFSDSGDVGQKLAEQLRSQGERCVMVSPAETYGVSGREHYQLNPACPEDFHRLVEETLGSEEPSCRGIVHLWSLEAASPEETTGASLETAQLLGCGSVLHLVQALAKVDSTELPRLWLVTQGAQAVEAGVESVSVAQSPVWGLGRVIAYEHSALRCTSVDLGAHVAPEEIQSLFQEFWLGDEEDQIALRGDARYVRRLVRNTPEASVEKRRVAPADQPFRLEISTPGMLDTLTLRASTRRGAGPGEVEIQVCATGLNFRDVMTAMGLYPAGPDEILWLGNECTGKIVALGEGVEEFQIGDEVIAMAPACFSAFATTRAALVVPKPAHLSFEEAATIPIAFGTAYYALHHLGRLCKGERVLIHAAAGGVGLAAVQIAKYLGAEIFATAGSPEKREFLRSLGIEHVMDSRSLAFADEVMERTGGQGVDVVLNSLAGEAIQKGLSCLGPCGRFLEIGVRDIYQNSKLGLQTFKNSLSFIAINPRVLAERALLAHTLRNGLIQLFEDKQLHPLPHRVFPLSEVVNAFRHMAQARHIGKIVVSVQEHEVLVVHSSEGPTSFRSDGTYLITGGLGGFGLTVAQWMVGQGARHLVLMGRHGAESPEAQKAVESMWRAGAEVVAAKGDVASPEQVAGILTNIEKSMPPLRGIIHAAMVLDDASVLELNLDRFKSVMAPKMSGAWNLHTLTSNAQLDFFVLFSSAASLVGSPGQGNYTAANVFLDSLAHYRRAQGLPAITINWGRLSEVGYVARHEKIAQRLEHLGMKGLTPRQAVTTLGRLLQQNPIQMGVARANWQQYRKYHLPARALLSHFVDEAAADTSRDKGGLIRETLLAAGPGERQRLLEAYLQKQVVQALQLDPSRLDLQKPLSSLGLDSLMAVELKTRIETDLGVAFPMVSLVQGPNISQLSTQLLSLVPELPFAPELPVTQGAGTQHLPSRELDRGNREQLMANLDQLSDKEVDFLLKDLLIEESASTEQGHK